MAAPTTPEEYLESVPPGRREIVEAVRDVINENLPEGYEEGIQYGAIGWYVPLSGSPTPTTSSRSGWPGSPTASSMSPSI